MVDSLKSNFPTVLLQSNYSESSQSAAGSSSKKITKPEDLVRIYDIILQVQFVNCIYTLNGQRLVPFGTVGNEEYKLRTFVDDTIVAWVVHITPILKEIQWLPVKLHLYYRDALLAFKCMNNCAPNYLSSQLITRGEVSSRETRNVRSLDVPLYKTATGQRTFHYRTVTLWNNISPDLSRCNSISNFKLKLRHKLLQQFLDSY